MHKTESLCPDVKTVGATMLRTFCSQYLDAVILQYLIKGERRNIIVAYAYFLYDYLCISLTQELRQLVAYAGSSGL